MCDDVIEKGRFFLGSRSWVACFGVGGWGNDPKTPHCEEIQWLQSRKQKEMCCGFDFELLRMQDEGLRGIGWLGERGSHVKERILREDDKKGGLNHTVCIGTSASKTTKTHSPVILNWCVCSLNDHRRSKALPKSEPARTLNSSIQTASTELRQHPLPPPPLSR